MSELVGQGVSGSRYCTIDGVVKQDSNEAPYTVANEFVASRLAGVLALPVPPGTIAQMDDGSPGFVMMRFGKKGDKPPPVDAAEFVRSQPHLAAGIVLFDAWILNTDRNPNNLAWYPNSKDLTVVFDHGHTLLRTLRDHEINTPDGAITRSFLGHGCLLNEVSVAGDVSHWIQRIEAVRDTTIREVCRQVGALGACSSEESSKLAEVLIGRRNALRTLIATNQDKFPKISVDDWGLIP